MIYAVYKDDGPDGPCGQSCSVTKSWNKLILLKDRQELSRLYEETRNSNRKNARITDVFDTEESGSVEFRQKEEIKDE